jgi:uncharacterized Zn-finger protein
MADSAVAHFHNEPGVETIRIRAHEFMCTGALPPLDHPHVYIDMGTETEAICPYCSTRFVYDPALKGVCEPAACEWPHAA